MKRRDFLKTIPLGAAVAGIPFVFGNSRASALFDHPTQKILQPLQNTNNNVLVMIFLEGGNDGLNTVVPFEDPHYDSYRPNIGFTTADEKKSLAFRPRQDLGMNPQMNALQALWQENKLAILQNVGNSNPDLSHFRSSDIWNSASDPKLNVPTGWSARYLETIYPNYPLVAPQDPLAISIGYYQSAAFFGTKGLVNIRIDDPRTYLANATQQNNAVPPTEGGTELAFMRNLISLSNTYAARFNSLFPNFAVNTVSYPDSQIAHDLLKVAWCIAAGLETKIYYVHMKGFDTHNSQFSKDPTVNGHALLLKNLADAMFAFQRDLEGLKLDNRVTTMTYSEFGRRVSGMGGVESGTDHGTATPQFILGSCVAGDVYGKTPDLAHLDANGNLVYEFEFRQMYASILQDWLGVDSDTTATLLNPEAAPKEFQTLFPINATGLSQSLFHAPLKSVSSANISASTDLMINPNPCRDQAKISFTLAESANVKLTLFETNGKLIGEFFNSRLESGLQKIKVNTQQLSAGSYYLHLQVGSDIRNGKIIKI